MSTFRSTLIPDDPVVPSARKPFDDVARQEADARAIACQLFLAECLVAGTIATWVRLDSTSPAIAKGDVVARTSFASSLTVTRADASPLGAAGLAYGIALRAAAPGSLVLVAFDGCVGPDITGLSAGFGGPARVTSFRAEQVVALVGGDFPLGFVDSSGWLNLARASAIGSTSPQPHVLPQPAQPAPLSGLVSVICMGSPTAIVTVNASFIPFADLAANDTDRRDLTVYDVDTAVGVSSKSSVYTTSTKTSGSGGSGDWTQLKVAIVVPPQTLAARHILVAEWNPAGAGIAMPDGYWRS